MKYLLTILCCLSICKLAAQTDHCIFDEQRTYSLDSTDLGKWNEKKFQEGLEKFRSTYSVTPSYHGVQSRGSCPKRKYVIPLVVHIVHDPSDNTPGTGTNISDQQVIDQIQILNEEFANAYGTNSKASDVEFYFCLAPLNMGLSKKSIFRYPNSDLYRVWPNELYRLDSMKGNFPSTYNYINIYIVDQIKTAIPGARILGFATHPIYSPGAPGIILDRKSCGDYVTKGGSYDLFTSSRGRVLVHEMGHYFGLLHTFSGGCPSNSDTCSTTGDFCCDTPPLDGENTTCTPNNSCHEIGDENDMIENHMDYTPDACRNTFTKGQVEIMQYSLLKYRYNLIQIDTLNYLQLQCCVKSAWFDAKFYELCDSGNFTFTAFKKESQTATYIWRVYRNGSLVKTYSVTNNVDYTVKLTDTGLYTINLRVVFGANDTVELTRPDMIYVRPCGPILKDVNANWYCGRKVSLEFHKNGVLPTTKAFSVIPSANGIETVQTAMSVSDTNGVMRFYGGGYNTININKYARLWYRDTSQSRDWVAKRSQSTVIKGSQNALQNLVLPKPGKPDEYFWFTLYNGHISGYNYYRTIGRDTATGYWDIIGPTDIPLRGPVGFPSDSNGAIFGTEAITAISSSNDSFYWLFLACPPDAGSVYDSSLVIFKVLEDTMIFFDTIKQINYPYYQTIKTSPDGRYISCNYKVFEFDRKTGDIKVKYDFTDYTVQNSTEMEDRNVLEPHEFSPNSRFLYFQRRSTYRDSVNFGLNADTLFQVDLNQKDPLKMSRIIALHPFNYYWIMQKAPNNTIILLPGGVGEKLDVIKYPDSLCTDEKPNNCGFAEDDLVYKVPGRVMSIAHSLPDPVFDQPVAKLKKRISWYLDSCTHAHFSHNMVWRENSIWIFGDGSLDSGREVSHSYSPGIYVVNLIIDGDTVTETIKVKQKSYTVSGRTLTCDTSQFSSYSVSPLNSFVKYNWSVTGGINANLSSNPEAKISWYDTGLLSVLLMDISDGCQYSDSLITTPLAPIGNNVISGDTSFCDTVQLTGSTPTGGTGTFTYSWNMQSQNLESNLQQFTKSLKTSSALPYPTGYIYRIVVSNGCVSKSNLIHIVSAKSSNIIQRKSSGCSDTLRTHDTANLLPGGQFQWQYSSDSIVWQNISGATNSKYNVSVKSWPFRYFRRVLNSLNCGNDTSNIIKVIGVLSITQHPIDATACNNMIFGMDVIIQTYQQSTTSFRWQYQSSNGTWNNLPFNIGGGPSLRDTASKYAHQTNFRLRIENSCFTIYSNTAALVKVANPSFTSVNNDTLISSGNSHRLKGKWSGQRNVCYAVWQTSRNPEGGTWDSLGYTLLDSFNVTPDFTSCQRRQYYRILLRNRCPLTGGNTWTKPIISRVISVGQYQQLSNYSDLWIADSDNDIGSEPNLGDTNNYTHSNHLWNRTRGDSGQPVYGWTDRVNVNCDLDTNFIHVYIQNRGNDTSFTGVLNLYWTINSTNEDWPTSWTGIQYFDNIDSGVSYPIGHKINTNPININDYVFAATGHYGIAPGDQVMITYAWTFPDIIPHPGWYYSNKAGTKKYSNTIGLCLLARIETCADEANYGMTYPEKLNYSTNYQKTTGNIGYNIVYNNNIVSANYYLSYVSPPFSDHVDDWIFVKVPKTPNLDSVVERPTKFKFCGYDADFYNVAEVLVTVPDQIWTALNAQSYPGNGYTIGSPGELIINVPCAEIGPILLPDTLHEFLGFTWRYQNGMDGIYYTDTASFDLVETVEDSIETGRVQFGIRGDFYSQSQGGGAPASTDIVEISKNTGLWVSPNPFNHFLDVKYKGTPGAPVRIEMLDANGKLVKSICECRADDQGKVSIRTETANLAQGSYTIRAYENGKNAAEKVIRCE
ncbi:MAG: zinc-dependent metalloprotease [Bacteroidetes bacterium]|nr:zinc-dependent metalloprotease [Bacteroidota bacterium]